MKNNKIKEAPEDEINEPDISEPQSEEPDPDKINIFGSGPEPDISEPVSQPEPEDNQPKDDGVDSSKNIPEPVSQPEPQPEKSSSDLDMDDIAPTPEEPSGTISKSEAKKLIKDTKGKFFTVSFIKKDGTPRVMNARLGVKAYLKGGELPYNPEEKGLIPVFDVQKRAYRMISIDTIFNLKIGNNEYKVK